MVMVSSMVMIPFRLILTDHDNDGIADDFGWESIALEYVHPWIFVASEKFSKMSQVFDL
jgi:hypothetical protein